MLVDLLLVRMEELVICRWSSHTRCGLHQSSCWVLRHLAMLIWLICRYRGPCTRKAWSRRQHNRFGWRSSSGWHHLLLRYHTRLTIVIRPEELSLSLHATSARINNLYSILEPLDESWLGTTWTCWLTALPPFELCLIGSILIYMTQRCVIDA